MSIQKTDQYKSWKSSVTNASKFPLDEHFEEIMSLHMSRKSRNLIAGVSSKKLVVASSQDINIRSRIVELRARARRVYTLLVNANMALRNFAIDEGYVTGKTVADRNASASGIIKRGMKLENNLESHIEDCDSFIEDIDKTAWALRLMLDGIVQGSKPEISI